MRKREEKHIEKLEKKCWGKIVDGKNSFFFCFWSILVSHNFLRNILNLSSSRLSNQRFQVSYIFTPLQDD